MRRTKSWGHGFDFTIKVMSALPSEIMMSYDNLLDAFEDASVQADCGIVEKTRNPCACFKPDDEGNVFFECFIHCKNWKWKSATNKRLENKRVSIILHIAEKIRRNDHVLLSSVVQVSYLDVEDGHARLLQSFHFDYDPCRRDHAIFHAQVTDRCINLKPDDTEALKIDFTLPDNSLSACLRSSRIPTCDMTFPSVLVSLAADHLGGAFFSQFWKRACELQQMMPLPEIQNLRHSLEAQSNNLRSSHWFGHMQV